MVNLSSTSLNQLQQNNVPSEVTRYLLNQREQVHIKLKTLGYCRSDIRSSSHSNTGLHQLGDHAGSLLKSQQQAFITIDNFSSEVLTLHNQLGALAKSGVVNEQIFEMNQRVLQSLTSVVQIMWKQLEDSRLTGERILVKSQQM